MTWIQLFVGAALLLAPVQPPRGQFDWSYSDLTVPPRNVERQHVRWVGSLSEAIAEARLRNAPIVTVLGHDTSGPLDYMLGAVYLTPGFTKLTRGWVCLIALRGTGHETVEKKTKDGMVRVCKAFGIACKDHQETYEDLFRELAHRTFWNPLLVVLDPVGHEVIRLEGTAHSFSRIEEELRYASALVEKTFGKPMGEATYRKLLESVARCRVAFAGGKHKEALRELESLAGSKKITKRFEELIAEERAAVLLFGTRAVLEAMEKKREDRVEVRRQLREIARDFAGTAVEKEALAAIAKLEAGG